MATTKLYLDTRANASGTPVPIKISLCHQGRTVLHSTGIKVLPRQWDEKTCWLSDILHRMDKALKQIGPVERHGLGGKKTRHPLFPDLSQYWCRHTWATIAAELDIPKETIAAGLGHGGNTVTDIYIRFDLRKVDEANRRVIDYVLGKRQQ